MSGAHGPLGDLRFADVTTFLAVRRHGSISGAARELDVTPSQVTKAMARLEEQLQLTLLTRTSRGVSLSDVALRLVPDLEHVVERLRQLYRRERSPERELTVAAPSYLCMAFLPRIAAAHPWLRLRGLQMAPALARAYATESFFDMAFSCGTQRMPDNWAGERVGELRKGLFARPELATRLGPRPVPPDQLREIAFITPINNVNGQFVLDDDDCPLDRGHRRLGHEAQTIVLALEMATRIDQLVFGPAIAARGHLDRGELVEIPVEGWRIFEPLYVLCNGERVLARARTAVVATLRRGLVELEPSPAGL
jgi:DNA-binding transcriptional LysR family regulator